jgi:lysosomal Pro-X carboxypeptidase
MLLLLTSSLWCCLLLLLTNVGFCVFAARPSFHPHRLNTRKQLEGDRSPTYKEHYFNQTLDHFKFHGLPRAHFQQRYLTNAEHFGKKSSLWNPDGVSSCKGPILFYTGNEGPIDAFWLASGFVTQHLAQKFGALVVFAEERYYGKSLPFGTDSLKPENAVYLSTEQVLADYLIIINYLKSTIEGASNCPVVAFGGSYGGTLTAYFRLKYPAATVGGLAASAPIGYYANSGWGTHNINAFTWTGIVNKVFSEVPMPKSHGNCLERLSKAVETVAKVGSSSQGRDTLVKTFHVCDETVLGQPGHSSDFFSDAIETIPQENYPYSISTMPAWPVNATCAFFDAIDMADENEILSAAANVTNFFYGFQQGSSCINGQGQGGIPGGGPGPASWGSWGYQSCTETLHQFSSHGYPDGLRKFDFNMSDSQSQCAKFFETSIDPEWSELAYGGFDITDLPSSALSNTILSHGLLDPWHGGGLYDEKSWMKARNVTIVTMPKGAHHFDLHAPNQADPPQVSAIRANEEAIIKGWISDYFSNQDVF